MQLIKKINVNTFGVIGLLVLACFCISALPINSLYRATGEVSFISIAPLETIEASSAQVSGIVKRETGEFAFSINITSFNGFNNPLQKEHFNEHYLESALYPKSTYTGNIIGFEDCVEDCEMSVTTKGKFTIHNITKILIIPIVFKRQDNQVSAAANFDIKLEDFDITIPKIVESKISPIIKVSANINLTEANE